MNTRCLLSVGYYPELLQLRSYLLRQNGYTVLEAGSLESALTVVSDSISVRLLLFCQSVPVEHQQKIMTELLEKTRVPVLSICRLENGAHFPGKPVSFSPEELLAEVKDALS